MVLKKKEKIGWTSCVRNGEVGSRKGGKRILHRIKTRKFN